MCSYCCEPHDPFTVVISIVTFVIMLNPSECWICKKEKWRGEFEIGETLLYCVFLIDSDYMHHCVYYKEKNATALYSAVLKDLKW